MRLLLLEDDELLGSGLRDFLVSEGHEVTWATRLSDLLPRQYEDAEALLVDWQLPDGSGLDWLRSLRQRGVATPALMLTARDLLADRLLGPRRQRQAKQQVVKPDQAGAGEVDETSHTHEQGLVWSLHSPAPRSQHDRDPGKGCKHRGHQQARIESQALPRKM